MAYSVLNLKAAGRFFGSNRNNVVIRRPSAASLHMDPNDNPVMSFSNQTIIECGLVENER